MIAGNFAQIYDLEEGITILEFVSIRKGEILKFVADTEDVEKIVQNGPWHWKDSEKSRQSGQLPVLTNREGGLVTKILMNPSGNDRVYNVSRNPFDIRKINLMVAKMGAHQSFEFKLAVNQRMEENRTSYDLVESVLNAGQLFKSKNEVAATTETYISDKQEREIQDQASVKTRVLKDLASDEIVLQFEDGTFKEISIHEAKNLAQILQRIS